MKQWIIKDWAGNLLDFKGYFKNPQLAVPMQFDSFDDAWEWIDTNIEEDAHCDVFACQLNRLNDEPENNKTQWINL